MVTVPKNHPGFGSKSYEEFEARDEGVEAIAQEDNISISAKRPKANRFSPFRKKAPTMGNARFARVVSEMSAGSQDSCVL